MSISKDKERIAITLTKEYVKEIDDIAKEMGITKSTLMQIATVQFIIAYKRSKTPVTQMRER